MMKMICDIEQSKKYGNFYRATVGSLKKALDKLPDDVNIGVNFDTRLGYTDIKELRITDDGLYILECD